MKITFLLLPLFLICFASCGQNAFMKKVAATCKVELAKEIPDCKAIDTLAINTSYSISKGMFLYLMPQYLYKEALQSPKITPEDSLKFQMTLDSLVSNTSCRADEPDSLYSFGTTVVYRKTDGTLGRAFKQFYFDLNMKLINRDSLYKTINQNYIARIGKYYRPDPIYIYPAYESLYDELSEARRTKDFLYVYKQ